MASVGADGHPRSPGFPNESAPGRTKGGRSGSLGAAAPGLGSLDAVGLGSLGAGSRRREISLTLPIVKEPPDIIGSGPAGVLPF
jgi:hypothetical protein